MCAAGESTVKKLAARTFHAAPTVGYCAVIQSSYLRDRHLVKTLKYQDRDFIKKYEAERFLNIRDRDSRLADLSALSKCFSNFAPSKIIKISGF